MGGQIVLHFFGNGGVFGHLQHHLAKGLAVNVTGVGKHNVYRRLELQHHTGNDRLAGGGAVKDHTQGVVAHALFHVARPVENQSLGSGGFGMGENILHRAAFGNFAVGNDGHVGADLFNYRHFVGDDDDRNAQTAVDIPQQRKNGTGGFGVKGAGGFVTQQNLGAGGQGTGDGDALLLAARKLRGIGVGLVSQVYDLQQLFGAGHGCLFLHPRNFKGEADVLQGGALHQQVELLKDHTHTAAGFVQGLGIHSTQVDPVKHNGAAGGLFQKVHTPYQGRFAGAAHTDDAVNLAGQNVKADILQGVYLAGFGVESFGKVLDTDDGLCFHNF